jgi:hypothetical protein
LKKIGCFELLIDTALITFHSSPEKLDMDELRELDQYLKQAKKKYHAIVSEVSVFIHSSYLYDYFRVINDFCLIIRDGSRR